MACVIEEPEDWEREYDVIPVASGVTVDPQSFRLRDYRTGQRVGVLANSICGLQTLARQHFGMRDPVLATDEDLRIGSDGYLMSLRRDAWVVAVPRELWNRMC